MDLLKNPCNRVESANPCYYFNSGPFVEDTQYIPNRRRNGTFKWQLVKLQGRIVCKTSHIKPQSSVIPSYFFFHCSLNYRSITAPYVCIPVHLFNHLAYVFNPLCNKDNSLNLLRIILPYFCYSFLYYVCLSELLT